MERGWALAAHYDYLKGVDNDLALRHVPEVAPRNDTLAGGRVQRLPPGLGPVVCTIPVVDRGREVVAAVA